ncbi:MAG: sialate O-acetylesterase, partial [Muribaculaceae bacterium]|nr:sialate O-acetylesterase [Muribaculaceae bacterium]
VWLCSGQSNMAFRVDESVAEEIASHHDYVSACKSPKIRLYNMKPRYMTTNEEWDSTALANVNALQYYDVEGWMEATHDAVNEFSAVGFSFGRSVVDSLHVPVGLICNAVGGSPLEAWIDRNTLETEIPDILYEPATNDMLQPWVRERAAKNVAKSDNRFQRHPYHPAYLYETGMAPLEGFPMRGLIWYQGESNAHNAELFSRLFPMFVDCIKQNLMIDGGVHFVQLTSMDRPSWPVFRNTQRRLADSLPRVDMAVIHDLGDSLDVHPRRKQEVGRRLALLALQDEGWQVEASGPVPVKAYNAGDAVIVEFSHAMGLTTSDGAMPVTFELARYDGLYYPATAKIDEAGRVSLVADGVERPRFVRYAWQPYTRANVVNGAGLPLSTFQMPVSQ